MSAWPSAREQRPAQRRMRRHLIAVAYLATTVTAMYGLAALVVLPLHGTAQALAFPTATVGCASVAGALTPRRAYLFTHTEHMGDQ